MHMHPFQVTDVLVNTWSILEGYIRHVA
jgi:hypothetical protein